MKTLALIINPLKNTTSGHVFHFTFKILSSVKYFADLPIPGKFKTEITLKQKITRLRCLLFKRHFENEACSMKSTVFSFKFYRKRK